MLFVQIVQKPINWQLVIFSYATQCLIILFTPTALWVTSDQKILTPENQAGHDSEFVLPFFFFVQSCFVNPNATSHQSPSSVLFIKIFLKHAIYTEISKQRLHHMCMCGVYVSLCMRQREARVETLSLPLFSPITFPIFPISIAWPLCFLRYALTGMCPLGRLFPPTTTCTPSISVRVWLLSFLSWCLPPLSPTCPSDLTDLTGPSLPLSLPLSAAPSTRLLCYSFSFYSSY